MGIIIFPEFMLNKIYSVLIIFTHIQTKRLPAPGREAEKENFGHCSVFRHNGVIFAAVIKF